MTRKTLLLCAVIVLIELKVSSAFVRYPTARKEEFLQLRAILADDNQIIETRGKCYQDHPISPFHLFAKFAWRLQNPTADCFLRCVMEGLSYMDKNGDIRKDLLKQKVQSNTDGRIRELLLENIDSCSTDAGTSNNGCEKSFNFLHCFYRNSLLTSLIQSLELFEYSQ